MVQYLWKIKLWPKFVLHCIPSNQKRFKKSHKASFDLHLLLLPRICFKFSSKTPSQYSWMCSKRYGDNVNPFFSNNEKSDKEAYTHIIEEQKHFFGSKVDINNKVIFFLTMNYYCKHQSISSIKTLERVVKNYILPYLTQCSSQ